MKIKSLSLAVAVAIGTLSPSLNAEIIKGKVIDQQGQPVANAKVQVVGSKKNIFTDEQGNFVVNDVRTGDVEIHFSRKGFIHFSERLVVKPQDEKVMKVQLTPSSIEVIDVTATPFHLSNIESAQPVSVLSGEALRRQQATTIGDTLNKVVGVHSNFHGSVASTPIIRGLDGPRVLITQNGMDVTDASRVGPDHDIASNASTASQIEVLRGPATLFYGSGAIGGVVNVVDNRVPRDNSQYGEFTLEHNSINDQKLAAGQFNTGGDNWALHLDGFTTESDNYETPTKVASGQTQSGKIENSQSDSQGFTLGTSYILDNGFVGVSYGRLEKDYGIPGHSHGDESVPVTAELTQDRYQLVSELAFDHAILSAININLGYTDYEHGEIEFGVVGTQFTNENYEARIEFLHHELAGWRGGISGHYKKSDFAAVGAEAFSPPSVTETFALALIEERHVGDWLWQLGARVERVTIDANNMLLPSAAVHGHDDDDHDHDHDHGSHDDHAHDEMDVTRVFDSKFEFEPFSLSAGAVWQFTEGYNLGISVSHAERAPSAAELMSFGPHIGTRSYEVGAVFALHQDHGESHLGLTDKTIEMETSNNIDLTFRKFTGDVGFIFNAFYNHVDNYYYQENTGLFAENGHNHDHGEHDHGDHDHDTHDHDAHDDHDHGGELPVYLFKQADAVLHGFEAQVFWQIDDAFKLTLQGDHVRARLKDGGNLPRTSPSRLGAELAYELSNFTAHISAMRYFKQDKVADLETSTDGYTLVDANVSWQMPVTALDLELYLKASNLTDEKATVHTSFIKDITPVPGRSFALGIRGYF